MSQDPNPNIHNFGEKPKKLSIYARTRGLFRRVLQLDDSPESIARGVALGVFVSMSPLVGLQMIIVAALSPLLKSNRIAGLTLTYIANPLTFLPIYWADYQVGRVLLGQESIPKERFATLFDLKESNLFSRTVEFFEKLGEFSWELGGPLFLGSLVVGALAALPMYPLTVKLVRGYRARGGVKHTEQEPSSS